jgi:hypothetical protein
VFDLKCLEFRLPPDLEACYRKLASDFRAAFGPPFFWRTNTAVSMYMKSCSSLHIGVGHRDHHEDGNSNKDENV